MDTIESLYHWKSSGPCTKQHFLGYAARKLVEKETGERAQIVGRLQSLLEDTVS